MAKKKESPKTAASTPAAKNTKATAAKPATVAKKEVAAEKPSAKGAAPAAKPAAKSAPAKPAAKPAPAPVKPTAKPAAKPAAKSAPAKPVAKSAPAPVKPAAKPAAKSPSPTAVKPEAKAAVAPPAKPVPPKEEAPAEKTASPEAAKAAANRPKAVVKPADAERAAKVAARQAEIEANKAARAAELKALTDARIAKAAEAKALIEAKKAERAAAIKAEADARAAKLAEIKAANAAKSATKVTVSKPASAPKAAKPDRKAPITAKPVSKAEAVPAFELGLSLRLDAKWDLVMQNALRDAAKAATQQLEALLQISAEVDQKTRRVLENDKRRLARVVDRAIGSALARLLEPSDLSLGQLQLNAEGTRLIAPTKKLAETAFGKAKILATYKDLVALIGQPNTLQQLGLKKSEMVLNFGDSLPGNYFFSGSFKLTIDRERSSASKVEQSFHLFGKQGKTLGVQMKVSFGHDLAGNSYSGQLEADFPVSKAEA